LHFPTRIILDGIANPVEAGHALRFGADGIGINIEPQSETLEARIAISRTVPIFTQTMLVTASRDPEFVAKSVCRCNTSLVLLQGETPDADALRHYRAESERVHLLVTLDATSDLSAWRVPIRGARFIAGFVLDYRDQENDPDADVARDIVNANNRRISLRGITTEPNHVGMMIQALKPEAVIANYRDFVIDGQLDEKALADFVKAVHYCNRKAQ